MLTPGLLNPQHATVLRCPRKHLQEQPYSNISHGKTETVRQSSNEHLCLFMEAYFTLHHLFTVWKCVKKSDTLA